VLGGVRPITISFRLRLLRSLRRSRLAYASRDGNFERYQALGEQEGPLTEFVRKKPFLIASAMGLLGLFAVVGGLAMCMIFLTSVFGDGPFRMNGEIVSKTEFLRFLVPFTLVYGAAVAFAGVTAWMIRSENPRSREFLLGYLVLPMLVWPLSALWGVPILSVVSAMAPWALVILLGWLYLYRKDSVAVYFDAIASDKVDFP
jgi:hypothetical protein